MDGTYSKGGSAGSKGVDFQVGLLQVFLLNALRRLKGWRLSTENKKAGKFDDVVLELEDSCAILLQAKFKENTKTKKITLNHLLSVNTKNDDFSIPKYFFSYEEVKKTFTVNKVIICTNASIDKMALGFLKSEIICPDSMLHYEGSRCLIYTCKEEILPVLRKHVENYCKMNLKGKVIDEAVINDKNLKEFLQNLQFYFNYPPEIDLEKVTELLLSDLKRTNDLWQKASVKDIHSKLKEWFQQIRGEYFTERRAKAMSCEIRSDKYCQMLESYNLSFVNKAFIFSEYKQVYHLVTEAEYLLKVASMHQVLKDSKTNILYVNPECDAELQRETIETFGLPSYTFLIIIRPKFTEESVVKEIGGKLGQILEKYSYKKIILVDQSDSKLLPHIGLIADCYDVIEDSITFTDLSMVIRKKLLKKKNIALQGYDINLKQLFGIKKTKDYNENINSELLEKLVNDEKIQIGTPILDLDEKISRNYIERKFQRKILTKEDAMRLDEFSESDILKIGEKFILLADSAGTGKSTVLSNLAVRMKKEHPDLWVIKIKLKSYTRFLSECLKKNKETVSITEILDAAESHKLKNDTEKFIFSLKDKIVLMMDGFDEISPYYTDLILSLFEECIQAPNLFKIFATTRPHMIPVLNTHFDLIPFSLQPLTEENQIHFFKSYWSHNLKLKEEDIKKCETYARTLVGQMETYLDQDNFTSVPLHLKILAESFQGNKEIEEPLKWKGFKEYLITQEKPKFPQKMNITELYKMFIEKKKELFLEKENPTGNELVNQALSDIFDNCLACHRTLALEVILDNKLCDLFTTYQESKNSTKTNVLLMGIVQKFGNDLNFVDNSFAEYFFSQIVLAELQIQNQNLEFQKFLIDCMLPSGKFKVARAFLDWFLREAVDSLPSNLFHIYQCHEQEIDLEEICRCSSLIHQLAEEGCVALLQLIFKCVDFKVIRNAEVHFKDFYKRYDSLDTTLVKGKTLYFIKLLVERAGVNIKDGIGWTPLHYAVHRLQVEMVKFLVENGADINSRDEQGRTALEIALNNPSCLPPVKQPRIIKINRRRHISYFLPPEKEEDYDSSSDSSWVSYYEEENDHLVTVLDKLRREHYCCSVTQAHRTIKKTSSLSNLNIITEEKQGRRALSRAAQAKSNYIVAYLMKRVSDQENWKV